MSEIFNEYNHNSGGNPHAQYQIVQSNLPYIFSTSGYIKIACIDICSSDNYAGGYYGIELINVLGGSKKLIFNYVHSTKNLTIRSDSDLEDYAFIVSNKEDYVNYKIDIYTRVTSGVQYISRILYNFGLKSILKLYDLKKQIPSESLPSSLDSLNVVKLTIHETLELTNLTTGFENKEVLTFTRDNIQKHLKGIVYWQDTSKKVLQYIPAKYQPSLSYIIFNATIYDNINNKYYDAKVKFGSGSANTLSIISHTVPTATYESNQLELQLDYCYA